MTSETPATIALVGAGVRGRLGYGDYCLRHPDRVQAVAVAEPDTERRERFAREHAIPVSRRFAGWAELLASDRLAEAVIVATPDQVHAEPAIRALELGYDVLLEKPIAGTPEELGRLLAAAHASEGRLVVAHPLRHAPLFEAIARLVGGGRIGRVMTIDHVENVGYLHFAHSYVRGNWRRTDLASPLILAKACHDLDLIAWLVGSPWRRVASFGSLAHFRRENAPPGAPDRCIDGCPVQSTCPFDSVAFYLRPTTPQAWVGAVTAERTEESIVRALRTGPYGRCVYRSDNDVADHQVTIIDFTDGTTASLTVSAFTAEVTRTIRVMGTHGELRGDLLAGELEIRRFTPGAPGPAEIERISVAGDFHGGGDDRLMDAFVTRLQEGRRGARTSDLDAALEASVVGHVLAFAAEESRRTGAVVRK